MIRLPFTRTPKDEDVDEFSAAFLDYCRDELERRRDTGGELDEERFQAAVDLAVAKLRALEENKGKA